MKKALSILLVIMLVLTLVPMGAFSIAASANDADYYTYTVADGNATITDVDASISGDIVIPSTLDGYRVTAIGSRAFKDCSSLISVTIPNSVTNVGVHAFENCTSLESAELPDSITTICDGMFIYCSSLEEVNIPDSIEGIGDVAFYECSALERVIIPDKVKVIEGYAFKFCTSLKEVVVPDSVEEMDLGIFEGCTSLEKLTLPFLGYSLAEPGLPFAFTFGTTKFAESNNYVPESLKTVEITNATSIPSYAFVNCKNIENIVIPDSVTTIGDSAFSSCTNLKNVYIGEGVTKITREQFSGCKSLINIMVSENNANYSDIDGVLFRKNKKSLILCPKGKSGAYIIPDGVTRIEQYAFDDCIGLISITIPDSVTSISIYAFSGCSGIDSITIPYGVKTIESHAFEGCVNLVSVVIENGVQNIGFYTFSGCKKLNSITIPDSVTNIGSYAFSGCVNLNSITIPHSVTTIEQHVFDDCIGLTSITVSKDNANYSEIDGVLFINNKYNKNQKTLLVYPKGRYGAYTIPNSVTNIDKYAFIDCGGLTSVTIPNSVIRVGDYAFNNCCSLECVSFSNSTRIIGEYAFYDCDSLAVVYYSGSEADRSEIIFVDVFNESLVKATWHYNACIGAVAHTYENTCDDECNICQYVRDGAHNYEWVVDVQENCGYAGVKHEECTICHAKRNENTTIKATNQHIYNDDCDEECNVCRKTRSVTHDYEWVLDEQGNCGYTGLMHEECTKCHAKRNENTPVNPTNQHVYDNDCDAVCNICFKTRNAHHTYDNSCDTECNVCYATRNAAHIYDNACDTECNVCHVTRETTHTYNGDYICDECGHNSVDISKIFPDTSNNAWYSDAVAYAYSNGILKGYANGKFGTSDGIQRQDFLVMLARYDGADLTQYANGGNFSDVGKNSYYEAAVNWGYANGIVAGYDNGKFGVGDKITREQLVTFLYRYANYKGLNIEVKPESASAISAQYKDYNKISTFSKDAVLWAIDRGVIGGKDPQTIAPQGNAQRCEIAQIMYNIFIKEIF